MERFVVLDSWRGIAACLVALYHLDSPEVPDSAEWKKARESDWTSRLQPQFRDHLRLVLRRYARGR